MAEYSSLSRGTLALTVIKPSNVVCGGPSQLVEITVSGASGYAAGRI